MSDNENSCYGRVKAHSSARISPAAGIYGNVTIGHNVCVLAGAQIRGDYAPVVIGDEVAVQENVVIHVEENQPVCIGKHSTIGHSAIVHGCSIGANTLVGMGSIIMNGANIGTDCVVAAGALVTEGKQFAHRSLIMGSPARCVRRLSDDEVATLCTKACDDYLLTSARMLAEGLLRNPTKAFTTQTPQTHSELLSH